MNRDIIKGPFDLRHWLPKCNGIFSLDTETTDLNYLRLELVAITICDGKRSCYIDYEHSEYKKQLLDVLHFYLLESRLVIFHNAPFDLSVLYKYGIDYIPNIFDTMTAAHLINENLPHKSLKYLAEHILKIPKEQIKKYDEVDKSNYHQFVRYAVNDAIWTYELYKIFVKELDAQNLNHLAYDIEFPFQYALRDLNINGIKVDIDEAKRMKEEVQHLYYSIENELLEYFGGQYNVGIKQRSREVWCKPSINFNSSNQVIPLVESLGFEITEKSDKGKKSWGKITKQRLAGKHRIIDLLIKLGKVQKLLVGFLEPLEGFINEDGKIRSSFHNTVAVTGRLSCSHPNLEQLPNENDIANIRNLYIASNVDSVFTVADYSGQELRVLGEETQDPTLKKAFKDGLDLHQITADAAGVSRKDAKTINFGIVYGKVAYGFAKDFNTTEKEAQKFLDGFFNKYPRVKTRMEQCFKQLYFKEYVTNLSGRKRRFPGYNRMTKWQKERCKRQAFNYLIQSYSADMVKIAAVRCIQDKNLKLVNIVHDELVFETHKDYVEKAKEYIRNCMVNAVKMSINLEVEIGAAYRYGEAK